MIARIVTLAATLAGSASLLLFVIFLFSGSLQLVDLGLPAMPALVWDGLLSIAFFLQHSGMIRRRFRSRLSGVVPLHYGEAAFAAVSGLVLVSVVVLWQTSGTVLLELQGSWRLATRATFLLCIAGFGWGAYTLKSFDLFGHRSIRAHLSEMQGPALRFVASGPYLWVRHPLYLFTILLIWSFPALTADRLLFNLLWTAWIFLGTVLEEKDLVADFGDDYRRYQRKVPMLIPWKGRADRHSIRSNEDAPGNSEMGGL